CSNSTLPTLVEPVKESLRASPERMSGSMTPPAAVVVTTFTTPSARPASARIPTNANVDSGVWAAGLTTPVHPAAIAGAILRVARAIGKFHGVINRHGPTGCLATRNRPDPPGACW